MLHVGVIYGVLLWADMNAATQLGAWGRSVMSLAHWTYACPVCSWHWTYACPVCSWHKTLPFAQFEYLAMRVHAPTCAVMQKKRVFEPCHATQCALTF